MKTIAPITRRVPRAAAAPPPPPAVHHGRAPEVRLEIGELVLHGFSRAEGRRVAAATRAELTRLVTAHGLPTTTVESTTEAIDAGTVRTLATQPEITGRRIAGAIYGGLRA